MEAGSLQAAQSFNYQKHLNRDLSNRRCCCIQKTIRRTTYPGELKFYVFRSLRLMILFTSLSFSFLVALNPFFFFFLVITLCGSCSPSEHLSCDFIFILLFINFLLYYHNTSFLPRCTYIFQSVTSQKNFMDSALCFTNSIDCLFIKKLD